jgi:hypothetical protein
VKFTEEYLKHMLSVEESKLLSLSVMKCPVRMESRARGFLHLDAMSKVPCLIGPLIKMDSIYRLGSLGMDLNLVLRKNLDSNPIVMKYVTMLESKEAVGFGVPVVSSEVIQDIICRNRSKDPKPNVSMLM